MREAPMCVLACGHACVYSPSSQRITCPAATPPMPRPVAPPLPRLHCRSPCHAVTSLCAWTVRQVGLQEGQHRSFHLPFMRGCQDQCAIHGHSVLIVPLGPPLQVMSTPTQNARPALSPWKACLHPGEA